MFMTASPLILNQTDKVVLYYLIAARRYVSP